MTEQRTCAAVAVLIPVYNRQDGLNRSCASLPNNIDYHVVVVDDGSSPAISIPSGLDAKRVTLLRLETNQGVTRALNRGLEWIFDSGYDYVSRLDAGDLMIPKRMELQLAFLTSHPTYAIVGGQAKFVDMNGDEAFRDRFPTSDSEIRRAMHGRNCFVHVSVTLRVAALRTAGFYDEHFPSSEDFEFFWRLLRNWKGANLSERVVTCDVNPRGISIAKRTQQVRSRVRILLKYFDPWTWESYAGLAKNLLLLVIPYRWVRRFKRHYVRSTPGWF